MSLDTLETFPSSSERLSLVALGRASVVFALGGLAYKGVALLSIPLLARLLSPAELGLLDFAAVLASLCGLVAVLGADQSIAFHEPRATSIGSLWASGVAIVMTTAAVIALGGIAFRAPLAVAFTGSEGNAPVVVAAALYGAGIATSTLALIAVRLHRSPARYALASFLIVTAEMIVAVGVAVFGDADVPVMVLGWLVGATVVAVPLLAGSVPRLAKPRIGDIKSLVGFGAPLVPAAVAWIAGDAFIRGALARETDAAALGEYGIAYRIASVLGLVVTGFGVAWYPYLYRTPAGEVGARASQALRLVLASLTTLGAVLILMCPEIVALVAGEPYAAARLAIGPLVGGMIALGVFVLLSAVIGARGRTAPVAAAAVAGAVAQAVAALVLVADIGLAGGGIASAIGYATAAAGLFAVARAGLTDRHAPTTIGLAALALSVVALSSMVSHEDLAVRASLACGAAVGGTALIWFLARREEAR